MKYYTYEQFLKLYDRVPPEVREQIYKNCYRFFMAWPEEKWLSTSHMCLFSLRVNGAIQTYRIAIAFIVNSARNYAREKCSDEEESMFFAKCREYSEKTMNRDVQRLQDNFQKYLHSDSSSISLSSLDMYIKQFATREEIALYQATKKAKQQQRQTLSFQRKEKQFQLGQKFFEIAIQYGFDSPEFRALSKEFDMTPSMIRARISKFLKSDLLSEEEKIQVFSQYRKALEEKNQKKVSMLENRKDEEVEKITEQLLQCIQSDSTLPVDLQNEAQILRQCNPIQYETYYEKLTGKKLPLYSGIRSVATQAKEKIKNHVLFTPTFLLECIFELGQPMNDVFPIAQSLLSSDDFKYFKSICNYYNSLMKKRTNGFISTMDDFMSQQIEVHCEKDINGIPIVGTGEQVTVEQKQQVVQLMESYHIPFCNTLYNAALRLYVNGNSNIMRLFEPKKSDGVLIK